ncbi:MAG: hypothetical protein IOC43_01335 [Methylobacterium sp.]|nr:hypothetical protein [Methylobacterium sp.]MCA3654060.1 hypothetical protein [Methylobacterium sp.]
MSLHPFGIGAGRRNTQRRCIDAQRNRLGLVSPLNAIGQFSHSLGQFNLSLRTGTANDRDDAPRRLRLDQPRQIIQCASAPLAIIRIAAGDDDRSPRQHYPCFVRHELPGQVKNASLAVVETFIDKGQPDNGHPCIAVCRRALDRLFGYVQGTLRALIGLLEKTLRMRIFGGPTREEHHRRPIHHGAITLAKIGNWFELALDNQGGQPISHQDSFGDPVRLIETRCLRQNTDRLKHGCNGESCDEDSEHQAKEARAPDQARLSSVK